MSKHKLQFERVEAFRAFGIQFVCHSRWNGLEEWHDGEGRKLIVAVAPFTSRGFADAFEALQPGKTLTMDVTVVSAHPDLFALLGLDAPDAP